MARNINYDMKLFSAIAIIAVCAGHISSTGLAGPFDMVLPYSYQVAAFVFISGYFYSDKAEKHPAKYAMRKFKRLIIPLLLINALYGLIVTCMHLSGFNYGAALSIESLLIEPFTSGHQFRINTPMWFIAPLFFAELINLFFSFVLKRWGGSSKNPFCLFSTCL